MRKAILKAFAKEIKGSYDHILRVAREEENPHTERLLRDMRTAEINLVCRVAKQFNPRFNEERFRMACGEPLWSSLKR